MKPATQRVQVTREGLLDDAFVAKVYAQLPAGARLRSVEELEVSIDAILSQHERDAPVLVFGYGSLMWNPAMDHVDVRPAKVQGWHRSFCLRSIIGRGSPERPGLMLGLDRGGACHGMLLQIDAGKVRDELRVLWRREMLTDVYEPRWVVARLGRTPVRAITFTVNRSHPRYIKGLPVQEMAQMINTGAGSLGTCREYFDATVEQLAALGIRDAGMERLRAAAG
ncbi:gamma-glutamylcyclotransferase [Variovorax soli]|uniref:glutathione-specific gamma-glutamylcyclotransferase n=1 Tax=Variovorax soli TaxID=376815 RepID=A0ABU1NKP6_9BURK|nr:gamma-glutamylcyclotransferase [Variovorax soli]MDR6538556.1 cation transport protein ChaC [Variovorax soli]